MSLFSSRRNTPSASRLWREPLEYAPSSTTTVNTARLNLSDPNYDKLALNYVYPSALPWGADNYLKVAALRCVFLPGFIVAVLPLVLAAFGSGVWFGALLVSAPLLVWSVAFTRQRRLARSVIAFFALALLTVTIVDQAQAPETFLGSAATDRRSNVIFTIIIIAIAFLTVVTFSAVRQSLAHVEAHPNAASWHSIVRWVLRRRRGDNAALEHKIFLDWPLVMPALWFAHFIYGALIVDSAGPVMRQLRGVEPFTATSLLYLAWAIAAAVMVVMWFPEAAVAPFMHDATTTPAPGLWVGSRLSASQRRTLGLLAVILVQLSIAWGARWGNAAASLGAPMFGEYRGTPPSANGGAFSVETLDVLARAFVVSVVSSLGVFASIAPAVIAFRAYRRLEHAYAVAHATRLIPRPNVYNARLASSRVRLHDRDDEIVHESDHLYLGFEPFQYFPVLLHRPLLHEHCYIVGDSGSGKTSLGLMPLVYNLAQAAERPAIVVLDLKGDMALFSCAQEAAKITAKPFRYFTPEPGRSSHVFNPFLDITTGRTAIQLAELLLDALSLNHGEGYGRSYYSRRNRDFLIDALSQDPAPTTFEELYATLERLAKAHQARYRDAYELLATMRALTFYPQLNVKGDGVAREKQIHFPTVLSGGQIAYFWLPSATESVSVREIGKLAVYALLSAAIATRGQHRTYLVIDEFQRIAAENFKVVLEQARSFGIGVILSNQSMSELETPSGDLRPVVRSNTRVKMHFSIQNPTDLKDISEVSGLDIVTNHTTAISTPINWNAHGGQETVTTLQTIKPRLTSADVLAISDHPRRFVLHVTRGSGLTQFGGRALPVEAEHITIDRMHYKKWAGAEWPVDAVLPVSTKAPVRIDQEARQEALDRQQQIIGELFAEAAGQDGFTFPD